VGSIEFIGEVFVNSNDFHIREVETCSIIVTHSYALNLLVKC